MIESFKLAPCTCDNSRPRRFWDARGIEAMHWIMCMNCHKTTEKFRKKASAVSSWTLINNHERWLEIIFSAARFAGTRIGK